MKEIATFALMLGAAMLVALTGCSRQQDEAAGAPVTRMNEAADTKPTRQAKPRQRSETPGSTGGTVAAQTGPDDPKSTTTVGGPGPLSGTRTDKPDSSLPEAAGTVFAETKSQLTRLANEPDSGLPVAERLESVRALAKQAGRQLEGQSGLNQTQKALAMEFAESKKFVDWDEAARVTTQKAFRDFALEVESALLRLESELAERGGAAGAPDRK